MDVSQLSITSDPQTAKKVINDRYRIVRKIGQGQSGKVLLAEDLRNKAQYVAIKTINRIDKTRLITRTYLSHTTKIKREIQIMKECNHPNVVNLHQVIDDLKFDKILLILEYCKFGDIDWRRYNHYNEKYNKKNGLTMNKILRDVINGLEYLHDFKRIIHRDLKPSNLLIDEHNTIKISDFGVSLILENNINDDRELGKTMGTPAFFAPELCQFVNNRYSMISDMDNRVKIDSRIDIWSLGVILYCLAFNNLPFDGHNEFDLFKNIVNERLKFPVIKKASRTTESDILELKFLKSLITGLLEKNPSKRLSIREIKEHRFTLFDLNDKQREEFLGFNKIIIAKQCNYDTSLTGKIKHFFTGKQDPKTPRPTKVLPSRKESKPDTATPQPSNLLDLEQVDDLLDSYLDDSSSFGSDYGEELEDIDTSSLLADTKSMSAKNLKPSPLILETRPHDNMALRSQSVSSSTQNSSHKNSPSTPTNSQTVTIGAGTPTSIKSFFSPSKRFFAKNKQRDKNAEKQHTIGSLYSTEGASTDFIEPPPIFGSGTPLLSPNSQITHTSSRKNSLSSSSNALTRIASSSSSLNLHAYLTDDNVSLVSKNKSKLDQSREERRLLYPESDEPTDEENANDTLVQDEETVSNFRAMHDYLDELR
ncbi:uncharacterized protein PRCAT00003070001 [Priceomyces carsonii]|uniref:uncharacterized protein n=1 Tax=Priceomyces carsonii TaxID=28549 RepID=UPI002EDB6D89|nr:unnamed protein product [Priceomyces carsonii]